MFYIFRRVHLNFFSFFYGKFKKNKDVWEIFRKPVKLTPKWDQNFREYFWFSFHILGFSLNWKENPI